MLSAAHVRHLLDARHFLKPGKIAGFGNQSIDLDQKSHAELLALTADLNHQAEAHSIDCEIIALQARDQKPFPIGRLGGTRFQ